MATKFSPCKGSYVLNQFPSNVMFGMNGFHVSASGAIQGHHGPLVHLNQTVSQIIKMFAKLFNYHAIYNRLKAIVNNVINVSHFSKCHIISLHVMMLMFFFKYIKHIFIMMDKYFKVSICLFSLKATFSSFKKRKM